MKIILLKAFLMMAVFAHAQIAEKAEDISPLLIGETIPFESLTNDKNEQVSIQSILNEKPTIFVFFRGGWCPYCNVQLSAFAQVESEILKMGYQIVAVTPESFENNKTTAEADKVNYKIYSDPNGEFMQKVGIAFKMPKEYVGYISSKSKGTVTEILPVPTVLVVDANGLIQYEYINVNYKTRMSKELLLSTLKAIN